jgi:hypothetical protein
LSDYLAAFLGSFFEFGLFFFVGLFEDRYYIGDGGEFSTFVDQGLQVFIWIFGLLFIG